MNRGKLSRRDFSKLTMAAFGGLMAGAAGCGKGKEGVPEGKEPSVAYLLEEPHVCRGLNTCANQGVSAKNACAGQGTCATAKQHECAGENECKGQGGGSEHPGQNGCKGLGGCEVPLRQAWDTARAAFESAMEEQGKQVGTAPAPINE
jgi:hypothetical protein